MNEENTKKSIFIVEDDSFLRSLLSKKLESEGYEIFTAENGETALKKIKESDPDLVLLDLILPQIDGFEVLKQLKSDSATKEIPVIILSNLGQREEVNRGLDLGAEDFMIKAHFTPREIIAKIVEKIDNKGD